MAIDQSADLMQFHQFLGEQLAGGTKMTPEDLLDLWRLSHPIDDEELLADVQEAIDGIAAGKPCVPAKEFFQNFRQEHGLSDR